MDPRLLRHADDAAELRLVALDLTQLCLDLAGIVDPTPVSDGASALISLARGQWFDALLSGASMVPYVGDLAKAGKFPKYLKAVERAIVLAQKSEKAAGLLRPVIRKLGDALDLLPDRVPGDLAMLRQRVQQFLLENRVTRAGLHVLPDISSKFKPKERWREGAFEYEQISGKLGVPGKVKTHRSASAQSAMSSGTGDHAGHRIGVQFGAPGGGLNLGLQNANLNTRAPKALQPAFQGSGGSYLKMEMDWSEKLKQGWGIEVTVKDRYRPGTDRPISRLVEWVETAPDGSKSAKSLEFLNTTSPQSRAISGQ